MPIVEDITPQRAPKRRTANEKRKEITMVRSQEIALNIRAIVLNVNAISEDELKGYINYIRRDEGIGPLLDPSAWQEEDFKAAGGTRKVLTELLNFKLAVKGIGEFK